MLIDIHAHDYPEAYLRAVCAQGSGFEHYVREDGRIVVKQDGAVALAVPQPLPSVEERLAQMDAAGTAVQVLSVSAPNLYRLPSALRASVARELNDELVATAECAPGRFRVFASLPLPDIEATLVELDRVLTLPYVSGVIMCTTIDRQPLDEPAFAALWAELSARRAIVFVHPTTACCTEGLREYALALGIDFPAETTLAVARLAYSGTFSHYSGIRWIFSHLGGSVPFIVHRLDNYYRQFPECREHIDQPPSKILESVYFDTVSTHIPALRCAFATFSPHQFVFGTDYPHVPGNVDVFVETLAAAEPSAEERSLVEYRTAAELLGINLPTAS